MGDTSAYMQNMYINGAWAELGSTQVDLSDYYKKSEVDTKLADKADKTELPTVPTLISAFTNDANYLTEFTETDPTVPAWAKAETKPSYTATEVGALPEDTEIPIFTNKTVLDGITTEKVADWDEAVADKHSHTNKAVIDKFTESDDGTVLYNGEQIASGNLWHGTKAEYDALAEKDVDTTYIVTDEEYTIADALIDDSKIDAQSTWSSKKINDSFQKKFKKGESVTTTSYQWFICRCDANINTISTTLPIAVEDDVTSVSFTFGNGGTVLINNGTIEQNKAVLSVDIGIEDSKSLGILRTDIHVDAITTLVSYLGIPGGTTITFS